MNTRTLMTTVAPLSALMFLAGTTMGQATNPNERPRDAQKRVDQSKVDQSKIAMYSLAGEIIGKEIFNRQGEEMGTVSDLIVDVQNGKAHFAIVTFGGFLGIGADSVAVPLKAMTWDRSEERFILPTTTERLKDAPEFNSENRDQLSNRDWLDRTRRAFGDMPEMDDREDQWNRDGQRNPTDRRAQNNRFDRYMLASDLDDVTIVGRDGEEFGSMNDAVIDRNSGHVGFVTFETGGVLGIGSETRIVPWEALERTQENEFRVALIGSRSEDSPRITNDRISELSSDAANREIYAYYSVEPRWKDGHSGGMNGTVYTTAEKIMGTDLVDRQGESFGDIVDFVVGFRNGSSPYAVVSHGGIAGIGSDTVAVPLRALSWDSSEDRYMISTTRRQFGTAPDFDSDDWDSLDSDEWRNETQRAFGTLPHSDQDYQRRDGAQEGRDGNRDRRDDAQDRDRDRRDGARDRDQRERRDGSEDRMNPDLDPYMLLSDLKGMTLVSSDGKEIGKIETVVLDRNSGHIGFVTMKMGDTLGIGGETVVIPWEAMRRVQEGQIRVDKGSTQMKSAPRIESERIGDLNDRTYRESLYNFYQVKERSRPQANDQADRERRERDQRDGGNDGRERDRGTGTGSGR